MEKIRILHCLETIGSGGVEQLRYNLSKYLDKERFEQKIVCTHAIGVLPERLREQGMEIFVVGNFDSILHIKRYRSVWKIIRDFNPHIIHGAVFEGVTMGTLMGRLAGVKGIVIEETSDPVDRNWKGNMLMRFFSLLSDKIVAESPAAGAYIRSVVKIKEPKLQVINNGVDIPVYPTSAATERLKQELGLRPGDFVVGSVGRLLDFHKKFSDLIKAVAVLKDRAIPLKLLIVGDGPDAQALKDLGASLDIADRVIFAGYQGDTAPYFACMDVFALASQMEAFGIVLVEAMLFRLPVVATAVGGIPYVVVDGETGVLVEKNAPELLADAVEMLVRDPEKRRRFGEAGYQRALREYTAAIYVQRIEQLYLQLVKEKAITV